MLKKALMATAIASAGLSAQAQTVLLSEGFDNVGALGGSGWVFTNLSSPTGTQSWDQGNTAVFVSQAGAADSYVTASFLSANIGGTVANWLISPSFSTAAAGTVSFWANAAIVDGFSDQIAFGLSTGSSSTGAFTLSTPVTLAGGWTQYSVDFAAQGAGSIGRFAIEYIGSYATSNYIGIDTFAVTSVAAPPIPEPSTYALMALGLAGIATVARRRRTAV